MTTNRATAFTTALLSVSQQLYARSINSEKPRIAKALKNTFLRGRYISIKMVLGHNL